MASFPEDASATRILVLTSTYPRWPADHEPGFVHELCKRLTRSFQVVVLTPHAPGARTHEVLDDVEVIRYRYAPEHLETLVNDGGIINNLRMHRWKALLVPGFIIAQGWHAWKLSRRLQLNLIHAHWLVPQGLISALLAKIPGRKIPFVVTSHGADLYALNGWILQALKRLVTREAAAVTVVSGAMLETLTSIHASCRRNAVMPMGVDLTERFTPDTGVSRGELELLFVGRLVEKKGAHLLLNAMPGVIEKFPEARLTIAGFGPEAPALRAQAASLGLSASVSFLGPVPQAELPTLYRRAALFVAPFVQAEGGDQEGLGLVLLEAVGCGCPILAGAVPALSEILGSDFDDMAVAASNSHALSTRIIEMLSAPAETRARAAQLRTVLIPRFDWRHVASRYRELFDEVLYASSGKRQ